MVEVGCECGKALRAPDSQRGKRGRCPGCGAVLEIPAEIEEAPPVLEEAPPHVPRNLMVDVGSVLSPECNVSVGLTITAQGIGFLTMTARGPGGPMGVVMLGQRQLDQLRGLLHQTEDLIASLKARGQMGRMLKG